eukprot:superscaffoldBa00000684_g6549
MRKPVPQKAIEWKDARRIKHARSGRPSRVPSQYQGHFSWEKYLKETGANAAPASCFRQLSSLSGFRLNASSWPMFLLKTLNGAEMAPSRIFHKQEPPAPEQNSFQVGMKLEAVDRKNPHFICPATVGALRGVEVLVTFDGWRGAFDYYCRYDSRDIFPVGWCSLTGDNLQPPGTKAAQTTSHFLTFFGQERVVLPKSLGALTDGSVESPAMHPAPTVGRPPVQRGRKPGRRKTKVTGPWSQKGSALGPQSIQPGKALEPIKIPKKRGPKPGSKLGWAKRTGWLEEAIAGPGRPVTGPGRPRGRLPANWAQRIALQQAQTQAEPIKIPKKRGPKPGSKRKPRVVPNPVPTSPTSSTPEPDTSTVPLDNATIPNSALQAPTVCVYLNKYGKVGPHLDQRRIQQLPDHFGPGRASSVLQQCVQACVDSAHNQATVFSCLKSGQGGEVISAYFDQQHHTLTLPTVSSVTYVLRFLEKLCHNLHCDPLFGSQPVARGGLHYDSHTYTTGQCCCYHRVGSDRRSFGDNLTTGPGRGTKRFLQESYNSPLPQKLAKIPRHSTDGESFMENSVAASEHLKKSPLSPNCTGQTPGLRSPSKLLHHTNSTGSFRESPRPSGQDPNLWTVEDVMQYIRDIDPVLAPHADLFRKHEIDGKALLLLRSDMMMKYMGLKLGPALKLTFHIDKLKRA